MDDGLKQQVFEQLRRGRAKAIPGNIIARRLGFKDDRRIRAAITDLLKSGIPIVSTTVTPAGFYIPETKEEVKQYTDAMLSRIVSIGRHRKLLRLAADNIVRPEQSLMRLDL